MSSSSPQQPPDPPLTRRREWATDQLDGAGMTNDVKASVLRLLDTWWTLGRNPEIHDKVIQTFSRLVSGHALIEKGDDDRWEDTRPGAISVRMEVRVKDSAYSGEVGEIHNGRRGIVVAIRHGDVIVDYRDSRKPPMKGVHHSPFALQRRLP